MDEFQTFLHSSGVKWSAICISETWLKPDILNLFNLENYNLFASCRESGSGGGTALYVHKSFNVKRRDDIIALNRENVFVEVESKNSNLTKAKDKNIIIGGLYRPPNTSHQPFISYHEETLAKIDAEKKLVVMAGDFNYNMLKQLQDKQVLSFCNLLSSYGYVPLISKATRTNRESSSLLDNIFVNVHNYVKSAGIIVHDLSDHFPVFASFSFSPSCRIDSKPKKVFDFSKMNELNDFIEVKLENFDSINDPNLACDVLINTFTQGINKFSRIYKPSRRKTPLKPWLTPSILCSINHKNKKYKKFIRCPNLQNENEYKRYRNMLTDVIREAKRLYYRRSFDDNKGNGK